MVDRNSQNQNKYMLKEKKNKQLIEKEKKITRERGREGKVSSSHKTQTQGEGWVRSKEGRNGEKE